MLIIEHSPEYLYFHVTEHACRSVPLHRIQDIRLSPIPNKATIHLTDGTVFDTLEEINVARERYLMRLQKAYAEIVKVLEGRGGG